MREPPQDEARDVAISAYTALFEPLQIKNLTIRNRFLSTSHEPGYVPAGNITD